MKKKLSIIVLMIVCLLLIPQTPIINANKRINEEQIHLSTNMPTFDNKTITEKMLKIFNRSHAFLEDLDQELRTYIEWHGDLSNYKFNLLKNIRFKIIYFQLKALVSTQDAQDEFEGYLGWNITQHNNGNATVFIYNFWNSHKYVDALAAAIDINNIDFTLWLAALIGLHRCDPQCIKVLYIFCLCLRGSYSGLRISAIEQHWDENPLNDDGVKISITNAIVPYPFFPEYVYIESQNEGDMPPNSHGHCRFH